MAVALQLRVVTGGVYKEKVDPFTQSRTRVCSHEYTHVIDDRRDSSVGIATGYGLDDRGVGVESP
jgi:hypothetical protein